MGLRLRFDGEEEKSVLAGALEVTDLSMTADAVQSRRLEHGSDGWA
jgi:hypothetical protein